MKRLTILILTIVILSGCSSSAKSAEQHGKGISIEMSHSLEIKHMTLMMYVNGIEVFNENVINADNSPFKEGDITWFDVALHANDNSTIEVALSYSENSDGTDSRKTDKIDISGVSEWVNIVFMEDYQIKVIDKNELE